MEEIVLTKENTQCRLTLEDILIMPSSWIERLDIVKLGLSDKPLVIDAGCGKGNFLVNHAAVHPEFNFIGIERRKARVRKVCNKIIHAGLSNVKILMIEISYAVKYLLPLGGVFRYFFFFPDPWPKRRHHKRRLFTQQFVMSLRDSLCINGEVHITTDHNEYFDIIRKLFLSVDSFVEIAPYETKEYERTEFEKVFSTKGIPYKRMAFARSK